MVRFARILNALPDCPNPASAENLAERGVGETLLHFFFFLPRPNLFYFGIGLGVHEILQVIPVKIIDTRKEEKKTNFTEFPTSFARICRIPPKFSPNFARICPNFARNLPEFSHRQFFFFGGGGGRRFFSISFHLMISATFPNLQFQQKIPPPPPQKKKKKKKKKKIEILHDAI